MQAHRFEVRPNHSLSWRGSRRVVMFFIAVTLGIGLAFASFGFWPVLPFAGLEAAVVAVSFWLVQRNLHLHEIIEVSETAIRILEKGPRHIRETFFCPRVWAVVVRRRARYRGHPSRLFIRCGPREREIGRNLLEHERELLAHRLGRLLGPVGMAGPGAG